MRCSTGGCGAWTEDGCSCGPLIRVDACNAVDWFNAAGIEDCGPEDDPAFDDDGELIYRGPIDIDWRDGYVWTRTLPETRAEDPKKVAGIGLQHADCGGDWTLVDGKAHCGKCGHAQDVSVDGAGRTSPLSGCLIVPSGAVMGEAGGGEGA
jgi:hypothetical protein